MKTRAASLPQAFTLIELLIVVAIIAILAAIAVPNFLEAQTRSKVARTVADMRSIAVALESYRVDSNQYPREHSSIYGDPALAVGEPVPPGSVLGSWVTTPIAYMTGNQMVDPFATDKPLEYDRRLFYQNLYLRDFNRRNNITGPTFSEGFMNLALPFYGHWRMASIGPDGEFGIVGVLNSAQLPYDPTNGTLSTGNIWRSQARAENNMPPVGPAGVGLVGPH